jgi:hypothetical protein
MAELKPLGSEKLNSDEKLKRILELTYYNSNKKINESKAELVRESSTGGVFGIVREKDGYYVKRGLNESSLDYIGGMYMKNKNKFSSYAEAFKRLEFIKGQEELNEATKYVLKQSPKPAQDEVAAPAPSMDAPAPAPSDAPPAPESDAPPAPTDDAAGTPDMGDATPSPEMDGDSAGEDDGNGKRSDYMAEVQKYAGKLGQELRDVHDRMESDDIKYVLNMIISAVDLDKLSDEDIEEIGKKFGREEDEMGAQEPTEPSAEEPSEPATEPSDAELSEDAMNELDNFINSPAPMDEISLNSYLDEEGEHDDMDETKELDMDEIHNQISSAVKETLGKYFK